MFSDHSHLIPSIWSQAEANPTDETVAENGNGFLAMADTPKGYEAEIIRQGINMFKAFIRAYPATIDEVLNSLEDLLSTDGVRSGRIAGLKDAAKKQLKAALSKQHHFIDRLKDENHEVGIVRTTQHTNGILKKTTYENYDLIVHEPKWEIRSPEASVSLNKLTTLERQTLFALLTNVGSEFTYPKIKEIVGYRERGDAIYYRSRLSKALGSKLMDKAAPSLRDGRYRIPFQGWSFCWVRTTRKRSLLADADIPY